MKLNTATIALHTVPAGLITYIKHFLYHRSQRKNTPTSQIAYDEGLAIIRRFLAYASTRPLGELQHFTNNHVPVPSWVHREKVAVPPNAIEEAVEILRVHLERDPGGLEKVGGGKWWELRGRDLTCEWVEMRKDFDKRGGKTPEKVLFYVHGGAYFFSSLETHRYQIQRHARKLGARAFSPSYRLAPQYPFPCILHDILASYLYLLTIVPASHILLSGDSAGAGAILSLLCILRDAGLPLPAGGVLISPWVDLSHSFPSVNGNGEGDYIPKDGFHYRPGLVWPPLREEGGKGVVKAIGKDGEVVTVEDQIQMYCPNSLLSHPLVSPVNQGSLGGLPPLLVIGGSSELLIDEIVYISHKAWSPSAYPPSSATLSTYPSQSIALAKNYPPTNVHLSVYDGTAHVTPTLSITRPAKFMYRQCADFGLWALKIREKKDERREAHEHGLSNGANVKKGSLDSGSHITPQDAAAGAEEAVMEEDLTTSPNLSDNESETSSISSSSSLDVSSIPSHFILINGSEPPFKNHMVRERVSFAGLTRPMEPISQIDALHLPVDTIGVPKIGPLKKWATKRGEWDSKYGKKLEKWNKIKKDDEQSSVGQVWRAGDKPPKGSVAGWKDLDRAKLAAASADEGGKKEGNLAMEAWNRVSMKPDESGVA